MRPNPLRDAFAARTPALGAWISSPSPVTSEIVARVDYDYICIDMQHGLIGYSDIIPILQTLTLGTATPTVRVPWNEPGIIGKVLDAGAMAVIVPMVNTVEQAEEAIQRGKYAPRGSRSSGPIRVAPVEGPEYADVANDHVEIIPMIETVEALENIDGILSVDGVNAIYVGPMDLGVSMGFGRGATDPAFFEALDLIATKCEAHGVVAGIHANPDVVANRIERGYRMATVQGDTIALRLGMVDALSVGRGVDVADEGDGGGY